MSKEFEMTDIGLMSYFLGIEVKQQDGGIFISQKKYMKEILEKFKMEYCNPVNTLGVNRHEVVKRRPDIVYGVGLVSRYMETPMKSNWLAAKRILRYIKGTLKLGLFYTYGEDA